jgi:hypothetical protein
MKYLVNKQKTSTWHEITADTLIDWTSESKEREKLTRDWLLKAKHGDIYVFGVNFIVALDIPIPEPIS